LRLARKITFEHVDDLAARRGVIGITPHMHLLGTSMKVVATLPDGTMSNLLMCRHGLPLAGSVSYAEAVKCPQAKDRCDRNYDNSVANPANPSNPPQRVRRGEQTTDEMCLVFFQVVIDRSAGRWLRPLEMGAWRLIQGLLRPKQDDAK